MSRMKHSFAFKGAALLAFCKAATACFPGDNLWEALATDGEGGTHSCGSRITWLQTADGGNKTEIEARAQIATEFPNVCGSCSEQSCDDVWNSVATDEGGSYSCGQRILWLQTLEGGGKTETEAKNHVAREFPAVCGACKTMPLPTKTPTQTPTHKPTKSPTIGPTETPTLEPTKSPTIELTCEDVWDSLATDGGGTYTCGVRISWLQTAGGYTENDARSKVASEFPSTCGPCSLPVPTPSPQNPPEPGGSTLSVVTQNLFWWNLFGQRGGADFFDVFRSYGPFDIFLFQECDDVARIRDGLAYEGMQIIQANFALAMMYSNRFVLRENGFDVVGEDRSDQYYGERGLAWARLEDTTTGKTFFVASHHGPLPINTGGTFGGENVANKIAAAIFSHKRSGDEVILGGDFNADENSDTVSVLKMNGFELQGSDWVDHILTLGPSISGDFDESTIIYDTGSDHRGIKTVWQF